MEHDEHDMKDYGALLRPRGATLKLLCLIRSTGLDAIM